MDYRRKKRACRKPLAFPSTPATGDPRRRCSAGGQRRAPHRLQPTPSAARGQTRTRTGTAARGGSSDEVQAAGPLLPTRADDPSTAGLDAGRTRWRGRRRGDRARPIALRSPWVACGRAAVLCCCFWSQHQPTTPVHRNWASRACFTAANQAAPRHMSVACFTAFMPVILIKYYSSYIKYHR